MKQGGGDGAKLFSIGAITRGGAVKHGAIRPRNATRRGSQTKSKKTPKHGARKHRAAGATKHEEAKHLSIKEKKHRASLPVITV